MLPNAPVVERLDKLHAKHVLPGFKDRSAEEREIDALARDITNVGAGGETGRFGPLTNFSPVAGLSDDSKAHSTDSRHVKTAVVQPDAQSRGTKARNDHGGEYSDGFGHQSSRLEWHVPQKADCVSQACVGRAQSARTPELMDSFEPQNCEDTRTAVALHLTMPRTLSQRWQMMSNT